MKKFLSLILALSLMLSMTAVFSACGKKDDDAKETKAAAEVTTDEVDEEDDEDIDEEDEEGEEGEEETSLDDAEESTVEEEEEDANSDMPQAGDTVKLGTVSVAIPEDWSVKTYVEGEELEIAPPDVSLGAVTVKLGKVYGGDHAKEWADATNDNYGGDKEIDNVTIGGKTFYRVKAKDDQNVCFTDIDDNTYLKVLVLNMSWDEAEVVLKSITIG